ncbi:GGDEF domain-containing protein [Chitinimonas sp.]|uniref:GGDEF domain-containing protein n=1 Tax=Chitinimonas sp. TaxID=1934313 RepID=UPI0035AD99EB
MDKACRLPFLLLFAAAVLSSLAFAHLGVTKPWVQWQWTDILCEGGTAIMAACWMLLVLSSRPGGRVTALLASGLGLFALGAWVDCLDEFFKLDHAMHWDNWLEGGSTLGGVVVLTIGLYFWRDEQYSLNEQLLKRERLFREHRAFDRITQLANADYLHRQIALEQARSPDQPCGLILLDIDHFHAINREHGTDEGDRVLQALSHLLLLNLRNGDLLCRYAGDRFAVLLPQTSQAATKEMARQLRDAVGSLGHHTRLGEQRLCLSARVVCALADQSPEQLLQALNQALEPAAPAMAMPA